MNQPDTLTSLTAGASTGRPLVSVVVPCYRGERFLAQALESCLRQTHRELEVIVVDDASPDRCAGIAEDFARRDSRVRVIRKPVNGGISRAFNTGYEAARGEFMTRLAQDDLFREDAVDLMVRHLERHPEAGLVYCDEHQIDENGKIIGMVRKPEPDGLFEAGNKFGICFLWRKQVWQTVGGFDPEFDTAEDYDFLLRVSRSFKLAHCDGEAPFYMRIHSGMGSQVFAARQEVLGATVLARHCRSTIVAARHLARGHFNAGYLCKQAHRHGEALRHLTASIRCWPFDWKPYKSMAAVLWSLFRKAILRK